MPASYTIQEIKTITEGSWLQFVTDDRITHLATDSRAIHISSGTLFFALQTDRKDGHTFIDQCYQKGIRHFIVHHQVDVSSYKDANFLCVKNTTIALQKLAAYHRSQFHFPVIGITGSNGKTIVKEWLYQLLSENYEIVRSPKSYNSQIGVPLSLWEMDHRHTLGIFEAGISTIGEMENLAKMIRPTIAVLTNIGDAHDEGFASRSEKCREKSMLLQAAGTVIVDADILKNAGLEGLQKKNLFTFGSNENASVRIRSIEKQTDQAHITIEYASAPLLISIPFTDDASVSNAITCVAVCLYLNIPGELLQQKFRQLKAISLRLEVKRGKHHTTIVNDSYSADLSSLAIAMNMLEQQTQHAKKTLIISDFQCAAAEEAHLYQTMATLAQLHKVQRVISVGEKTGIYLPQYLTDGITHLHFASTDALIQAWEGIEFSQEAILVKGARIFELERILPLLEEQAHQTRLEINLSAIASNLRAYRQILSPDTKLMVMVKAFSYGSGAHEIAALSQYHGAAYLAVAFTDEGVTLRRAGITLPIMVMNPEPSAYPLLVANQLEPEIFSFHSFKTFDRFLEQEGISEYPVHIKVDTGMHRLGFLPNEMEALCAMMLQSKRFLVRSVFSHLVAAEDAAEDAFTEKQRMQFEACCDILKEKTGQDFLRHLSNTSGIMRHPQLQYEMVRLGIGMYGIAGTAHTSLKLEPALSLKTTIAQIKQLNSGDTVGYNRSGKIEKPTNIATVRIGYADGYPRSMGNGNAYMLINGKTAPTIGKVCMDMTMLDITGIEAAEGDEVLVFGNGLPITQLAAWHHTIAYEMMTGISQRVKRVYYEE